MTLIRAYFSRLTFQTCYMDQPQERDASNAAGGWSCEEICNVSENTVESECHCCVSFRLRRGIQRRCSTFGVDLNNAMCRGGSKDSKVPLIVFVQRVVAEK